MNNCARCSPLSRLSGAGRRTEHPVRLSSEPQRLHDLTGIVHRRLAGAGLDDGVDQGDGRRISHAATKRDLLGVERAVVLAAGVADAVVVRIERLHDRFAADLVRARRGPRPASAAGTCARRRGNRRARARHRREITPTSVTRGKSCPFAIICVPTSTSSSPAREPREQRRDRAASANRVAIDAGTRALPGTASRTSASTRSVPNPSCSRYGPAQFATRLRQRHRVVAVVAARAPGRACEPSATRCSSDTRASPRTAGRTRRSRIRAGSAARSPARRARSAIGQRVAQRARSGSTSGPRRGVLLAHVDDPDRGHRPIEHAPLERHERVAAALARCGSSRATGVAEPSTTSAPAWLPRTTATSRP